MKTHPPSHHSRSSGAATSASTGADVGRLGRSVETAALLAILAGHAASALAGEVTIDSQKFTLPAGYELSRIADSTLVPRPVSGSFDEQGRLYVTDSSGSNLPPAEQLKKPDHRILRLEDTDGDGRFDKAAVFADKVMFPQGCLWHQGSVYVAAPPSIWKFTDSDGDGVADKREEWFKGGTLTGCANDIHGPYLGPDGFIYWTKGAFAEQKHERPGRSAIHDSAAHIYRARPDGSGLEVVMSGGMDNPVEVAFTSEGEAVFTSTFIDFSQPGWRDGIAHALHGGVYGKQNHVLEDGRVIRTSPDLLHPFVQFGAGAPSGLCRPALGVLSEGTSDTLFASTFNLHKITRHVLRLSGASYASENSDFLVSDSRDFHPTDVLEDADGSLIVVDTGGWYKLCCPTSQLAKPDVLGGIYRIRRTGVPPLSGAARKEGYRKLTSPPPLRKASPIADLKRLALKGDPKDARKLRAVLKDHLKKTSESPDSAHRVRVAAEGLGRMTDVESAGLLLEAIAWADAGDPYLRHSLILALIEIGDVKSLREALTSSHPAVVSAALTALDQSPAGGLKGEEATPHLTSKNPAIRKTAAWVLGRHPEWAGTLAGSFRQRLASPAADDESRREMESQLGTFARNDTIAGLLAEVLKNGGSPASSRRTVVGAMAASGVKEAPAAWHEALAAALKTTDGELLRACVATARALPAPKGESRAYAEALRAIGSNPSQPASLRLTALAAVPGGLSELTPELFAFLQAGTQPERPVTERGTACGVLAAARLSRVQTEALLATLATAGPLEIPPLITAFEKQADEALGLRLLEALASAKAVTGLHPDLIRQRLKPFPASVREKAEPLLASLNQDLTKQKARLETLLDEVVGKGDIRRGQALFNSPKAACASCHSMGYLGGKLGPDLTRIGEARTEKDLLESILYPSASFVRSYEPMMVELKDGEMHNGVVKRESPEEIILGTGPETEVRIARSSIAEMRPGSVSVMPQGLEEQLTRGELADLLAFLKNTRWGAR